ncbi:TetR/AcrR family transcriptional regulator [Vibrio sp. K4]|uniref:TetR/AcrR family transcriptional regulator n=1 Tax=Vibrio sp. K4 TaxID=3391579 RepID=UPI003DA7910D
MSKIEQNREKKRRAILEAAKENFLSEGYVLANMDKISAQAGMTKQTVYRYFPSKAALFEATLRQIGEDMDGGFITHLQKDDLREALNSFGEHFVSFHLSDEHLATFRLLIAESAKAPEITTIFREVGPDDTDAKLTQFFQDRFDIKEPETQIRLWTGMLLSIRSGVLMGMEKPTQAEITEHVQEVTEFLLAAIEHQK